jgi:3-deoxy-D-manno-octulosonic-acid transferase
VYFAYTVLLAVGFVLALPHFLWKGRRSGKYRRTFRERMGALPPGLGPGRPGSIWVHAVSVGEVLAARPLLDALKRRFPKRQVFLSTTTLTGRAVAERGVAADGLFFAPFDFPGPVRRALSRLDPELLILVETELWPNLVHQARRRGTRVALVNGRISPRSHPRYRRAGPLLRRMLAEVDLFLMQSPPHAERVLALGAPPERVRVAGNLKFDAPAPPEPPAPLARLLGDGRPVWVAGSTVEGEEAAVLAAFGRVRQHCADLALVLVPRHPERFDLVPPLVEEAGFRCLRRSQLGTESAGPVEVVLLDTLGELAGVYALATVVFVGGSLVPAGGHNVLEAAAAGKPILVGPHMENFQEIADQFRSEGALIQVASAEALADAVSELLADAARRQTLGEAGRALLARNRGALTTTLDAIEELLA